MGKIDELIQQYCPEGVENVRLEDCCKILDSQRKPVAKGARSNGIYPYYGANGIQDYVSDYIFDGTYVLVGEDGSVITKNGNPVIHWATGKIWVNNHAHILGENDRAILRYLFFILQTLDITPLIHGNIPKLTKGDLKDLEIPLPPLPVQEEIVRILDNFTNLAAELQAELQARQQQYNYYRDNLLTNFTPGQKVKEYTLGELGTFKRGNGLQKKDFTETGIGCIHYGQIYTKFGAFTDKTLTYVDETLASRLLQVEKGNLVIACTSENVEDICKCVAWLGEDNICTGGHACVFRHKQNPKYIAYFFQTEYFFNQKVKYTYGTKVKDIKPDSIAKIKIPLPSLEEQERIVSILDNLYTLTNDLTIGLPAEIEARRQQYEYYRDQLLTFTRKA
jgi:type I restriction enzyme S subunit